MESKLHFTPKQLASIMFIFATLVLLAGLFLSAVQPANAQTGTTGTATAGVPVTGQNGSTTGATTNRSVLDTTTLKGFTVVDRNGTQIGTVDSLLLDLRNASVCASTSSTAGATGSVSATSTVPVPVTGVGTPTAMVGATSAVGGAVSSTSTPTTSGVVPTTGGTFLGWQNCTVSNASQASGVVSYVVVDRSGVASNSGGTTVSSTAVATSSAVVSSTAVATSSAAVGAATPMVQSTSTVGAASGNVNTSGNLVPVPWRFVRINLDQRTVIVDTTEAAFSSAPGFTSGNVPDVFAAPWTTNLSSFWNNSTNVATGAIPNTGGNAQATAVGTSTSTVSTVAPTATSGVVATSAPTATSGVVATTAPTATSAVVATSAPTATSAVSGVSSTPVGTATSSVVSTVAAPGVSGTPTALVPVTGVDLAQVQEAAAAQQRMILDIGIVGVGLVLLALGIIIKTGKS